MISQKAEVVLRECGVASPSEILLEAIAWRYGAQVIYEPLSGVEAQLIGVGSTAVISVNRDATRERQRFSIAHELGHWAKHRGKVSIACGRKEMTRWSKTNPETQANEYAAQLLMPEFMFAPRAQGKPVTFESVGGLASQFRTSLTATGIRLVQLGSFPSMIVWTRGGKRRGFRRSPDLPDLFPCAVPGKRTLAGRIARGEMVEEGAKEVPALDWFDHDAAVDQWLVESAITMPDGAVVSLLWWEDEGHLEALEGLE